MNKCKILFLAASPKKVSQVAFEKEINEIEAKIRAAEYRDTLQLIPKLAVKPDDLQQALPQHQPHIVHFCGHGLKKFSEIILHDADGKPAPVTKDTIKRLLKVLKGNIRLVVFNACFSQKLAEAVVEVIDCAVGTSRRIGDQAAVLFGAAFYRAIGFGCSVQDAFELGKNAVDLADADSPETFVLLPKAGVNPNTLYLISPVYLVRHGLDARAETVSSTLRCRHPSAEAGTPFAPPSPCLARVPLAWPANV